MKKIALALFLCPLIARGQLESINLECAELFSITTPNYLQPVKDNILKLSNVDFSFKKISETSDGNDLHITFQEYYKDVPVEFAIMKVHFKENKLDYVSARYQSKPLSQDIIISEREAFAIAKARVPAEEYIWDRQNEDWITPELRENTFLFPEPHGQLIYYCDLSDKSGKKPVLAYKFQILATNPHIDKYVYVDCINGNVIRESSLLCNASAQTRYSGTQNICTDNTGSSWRLYENGCSEGGGVIHTFNMNHSEFPASATEFTDADNNWTAAEYHNSNKDDAALDAHWGAKQVYLYWKNVHGRNSLNDAGMTIKSYVHYGSAVDNAFWSPTLQIMQYGDGDVNFNALTSIDVVGHEMGHGICQFTTGTMGPTGGEWEAINEGLSDIWGACIENYAGAGTNNWLIGEQITIASGKVALRSLSNPKATNVLNTGPDTYLGTNWDASSSPDPHINGLIVGHWFFLLTNGGTGINDNWNAFSVNGIGFDRAAKITYKAENDYFAAGDDYTDIRAKTIHAARDLYGDCSVEVASVINAWYAVGVGSGYPIGGIINVTSPVTASTNYDALYINGSSSIAGGINVEFKATRQVNLTPGFETFGQTFLAIVEPCTIVITAKPSADHSVTTNPLQPDIDNTKGEDVKIYPNPNNGSFTISLDKPYSCEIAISNSIGQVIYTGKMSNEIKKEIKLDDQLPDGNYIIQLNGARMRYREKITLMKQ